MASMMLVPWQTLQAGFTTHICPVNGDYCVNSGFLLCVFLFRVTGLLGPGQFGMVNKGVWQSPAGAVKVAMKTLESSASQEDRVKFLQEAAINGQFRHPNVVELLGVVTVGEPVRKQVSCFVVYMFVHKSTPLTLYIQRRYIAHIETTTFSTTMGSFTMFSNSL